MSVNDYGILYIDTIPLLVVYILLSIESIIVNKFYKANNKTACNAGDACRKKQLSLIQIINSKLKKTSFKVDGIIRSKIFL